MAKCSECGKTLGFFESKKMFSDGTYICSSCFYKSKERSDICSECGKKLGIHLTPDEHLRFFTGRKKLKDGSVLCEYCFKEWKAKQNKLSHASFDPKKQVKEYKRECNECGKVWHSLASREEEISRDIGYHSSTQFFSACGGNFLLSEMSKKNAETQKDLLDKLKKCPNCSSRNYEEKVVIYEKK